MNNRFKNAIKKYLFFKKLVQNFRKIEFVYKKSKLNKDFDSKVYLINKEVKLNSNINVSNLNVLWIGADANQDKVGFLDELSSIVNVVIFKNDKGEDQLFFDSNEISNSRQRNKNTLIYYIKNYKIDLIIGQFWPELIDFTDLNLQSLIKEKSIKSICIGMDDFMPNRWISDKYADIAGPAGFGKAIDLYTTSDLLSISKYSKLGLKSIYLPFGCSHSLQKEYIRDIDVSFVGSNYGMRKVYIDALQKSGINIKVYGPGFENGKVTADEIIEIYNRSKIILGISQVGYQSKHRNLKTRDFDAISSGALYISNSCDEFDAFFTPGYHYIKFVDIDDLIQKIKFFLDQSQIRNTIAANSQKFGFENYLWRNNLKKAISFLYE